MRSTILKDPLRHARYIAMLFMRECLRGGQAQRLRFYHRIMSRIGPRLGLYAAASFIYTLHNVMQAKRQSPEAVARVWRYRRWQWATSGLSNREFLRAWTDPKYKGGPRVVVIGLGSVGDAVQITPVLRALRAKLPTAQICLLHHNPIAQTVLYGNRNFNSFAAADLYSLEQIKRAIAEEGAADLVLEIPSILYTITYTRAPKALRHPDFDKLMPEEFFAKAEAALAPWKRTPSMPLLGAPFAWPSTWRGHYLETFGATGNLPIDRNAALDFVIEPADRAILKRFKPEQRVVTIQNGADPDVMNWARATGRVPTKLLPMQTWRDAVRQLRAKGYTVVQIGITDDAPVPGVSYDLRGKTTLREAGVLMQAAVCHIGTEGGLAHLAHAVGAKAVVLFGPSDAGYVGYPENVNLADGGCAGCCWVRDWFIYCPRGFEEPPCMQAHHPETIVEAVVSLDTTPRAKPAIA